MPIFKLTSILKLGDGSVKEVYVEADSKKANIFTLDDQSIGFIRYSPEDKALNISKMSGNSLHVDTAMFVETAVKISLLNKKEGHVHFIPDFNSVRNYEDRHIDIRPLAPALYREGFRVPLDHDVDKQFGMSGDKALSALQDYLAKKTLTARQFLQKELIKIAWLHEPLKEIVQARLGLATIDDETLIDNLKVEDFFEEGMRNKLLAQIAAHPEETRAYTELNDPKPMYIPDDILLQKIKEWGEIVPLTHEQLMKLHGSSPQRMKHYALPARIPITFTAIAQESSSAFFAPKVADDKQTKTKFDTAQLLSCIAENIKKIKPNKVFLLDEAQTLDIVTRMTQRFALGIYRRLLEQYGEASEVNILSLACGHSAVELIAIKSIFQLINPKIVVNFFGVDVNKEVNDAMRESFKDFEGVRLITADATSPEKLAEELKPNSFDIVVCRHPNIVAAPEIFSSIATKTAPRFAKKDQNCAIFSCYNEDEFCFLAKLPRKKVLHKKTEVVDSNKHIEMQQIKKVDLDPDQFIILSQFNTEYRPALESSYTRFFAEEKNEKHHQIRFFGATGVDKNALELDESEYQYAIGLSHEAGEGNVKVEGDAVTINKDWVASLDDQARDELSCGLGIFF